MAVAALTASTPLALAEAIRGWFPNLDGRAVAVADCGVTRENEPNLPLCMVAFAGEATKPKLHSTGSPKIVEKLVVEFWRRVEKLRRTDGAETPFYAYVDYRRDRDVLLHHLADWLTPDGSILAYQGASVVADDHAYTVQLHFVAEYEWCDPFPDQGVPLAGVNACLRTAGPFDPSRPALRPRSESFITD